MACACRQFFSDGSHNSVDLPDARAAFFLASSCCARASSRSSATIVRMAKLESAALRTGSISLGKSSMASVSSLAVRKSPWAPLRSTMDTFLPVASLVVIEISD